MALSLTPRIYGRNFKWGILPSNKVDTVVTRPILNTIMEEASSFTQDISSVTIKNNDGDINTTLPIANTVKSNRAAISTNYEPNQIGAAAIMCIGNVMCAVATGSVIFELDNPLPTMPSAKIHCEGKTYYVNRGSKTHADIRAVYEGDLHAVPQWIQNNASDNEEWTDKSTDSTNRGIYDDPTLIDYTKSSIPLYPWVRKIIPTSGSGYIFDEKPLQQDILTTWVDQDKSSHWAQTQYWSGYNSSDAVTMWPAKVVATGDVSSTKISLKNQNVSITTSVIKIDDYTYKVEYSIPVRYTYYASSQYYTSFLGIRTYYDLDNYCFMDLIDKLQIELVAQELNQEYVDLSFSLDTSGQLTREVINEHPLSFNTNELITSEAYWGDTSSLWSTAMSQYLLEKFGEGKYIVECEVPAAWALRNDIHINSVCNIRLQDNTLIARDDVTCSFEVKTIEKRFKDNNFIYILRLMEV